jgi:hypothetical protein
MTELDKSLISKARIFMLVIVINLLTSKLHVKLRANF